jgi:hypothetical protein
MREWAKKTPSLDHPEHPRTRNKNRNAMDQRRAASQYNNGHGHPRIEPPPSPAPSETSPNSFVFFALALGAMAGGVAVAYQQFSQQPVGRKPLNEESWDDSVARRPSPTRKQLASTWDNCDKSPDAVPRRYVVPQQTTASAWGSGDASPSHYGGMSSEDGLSRRLSV